MKHSILKIALLSSGLMCSACTYTHIPTAIRLASTSPLEADPADFTIEITLPEGVGIQKHTATLSLEYSDSLTGDSGTGTFILQETRTPTGVRYKVALDDLDAMRMLQSRARHLESRSPKTSSGSLSVGMQGCKTGADFPIDETFSAQISYIKDGPMVPLLRNVPLSTALEAIEQSDVTPEELRALVPLCTLEPVR